MKNGKGQELMMALVPNLKKVFGNKWEIFVVRTLNEAFRDRKLSATQKQGIIACIPKRDQDKNLI